KVERPRLPEAPPGAALEWSRDGSLVPRAPMTPRSTTLRTRRKQADRPAMHPLLVGAREHFDNARESYDESFVRPFKHNLVDLCVTKDALARALEVANALFLSLEDRGQRVVLAPVDRRYRHVACEPRFGHERRDGYD